MSLCIAVGKYVDDGLEEQAGSDFGPYGLLYALKCTVAHRLESGKWGSRFPLFMNGSDTDAQYTPEQAGRLAVELGEIQRELVGLSPEQAVWAEDTSNADPLPHMTNPSAESLADYLVTVDREPALAAFKRLADIAAANGQDIIFT